MPKQPKQPSQSASSRGARFETVLAFAALGVIIVSIICMFSTLVISARSGSSQPAILAQIPLFGLPLGALLIITLVIVSISRKRRENRR